MNVSSRMTPFQLVAQFYKDATGKDLPKNGTRVPLSADDAQKIQGKLQQLPEIERAHALSAFDLYKDRFEWSDRRPLLDVIGASTKPQGEKPAAGGRLRNVQQALGEAIAGKKPLSAKTVKDLTEALAADVLPKGMQDQVRAALKTAMGEGDVKVSPEARPTVVKDIAKHDQDGAVSKAAESIKTRRSTLGDMLAKAKCFEDLVAMFMFEMAKDMQDEVKEKMDFIRKNDPSMPKAERLQTIIKAVSNLPAETQANVAAELQKRIATDNVALKDGPAMEPLKAWMGEAKAAAPKAAAPTDGMAADATSPYTNRGDLPPISNEVARAMVDSDDPHLANMGAVVEAQALAKEFAPLVKDGPEGFAKLTEEKLLDVRDQMMRFDALTKHFMDQLPESVQNELRAPPPGDMVSRQSQFEELKMLMNEFSQVMQALSNIISTMDSLAMHSIRKIEAR